MAHEPPARELLFDVIAFCNDVAVLHQRYERLFEGLVVAGRAKDAEDLREQLEMAQEVALGLLLKILRTHV